MADVMVILDMEGPAPVSATFNAPSDGPVMFVLSGTAWTQNAPTLIGINMILDGEGIGSAAMCYANQNANHQALRPTFIAYDKLSAGEHTIEIEPAYGFSVTDENDYFQVALFY